MQVEITSSPVDDVNVTNQHLIYTIYDDDEEAERYIVQVFESTSALSTGAEIAKVYLTPNALNRGVFDLSDIVGNRLQPPTATTYQGNTSFIHSQRIATASTITKDFVARKYTIRAGGLANGQETLNQDSVVKYLIAGAWQIKDGKHPAFTDFYAGSTLRKAWLTNLPSNSGVVERLMADEDEGVALILKTTYMGFGSSLNRITYRLYDDDGQELASKNRTISTFSTINLGVNCVPMGPFNLQAFFADDWDRSWAYCDLIPMLTTTPIGATLRIRKDCRPIKHQPVQLAWTNSVGGWDMLRFDARAPKTIQKNEKRYRKDPLDWQGTTTSWDAWDRQNTTFHNEGKIRFTLTHDQFNAEERALLEYCMRSKIVYYRYGTDAWAPCVVDTNSLVIEPAGSKMFRVSLTIEDANPVRC